MEAWRWIRDALSFALGAGLVIYERIDPAPTDDALLIAAMALLGVPFAAAADRWRSKQ